jgi:SAM-dependent methyltransferase
MTLQYWIHKVRPHLPLIAFVIPTVVVGYGFVIPNSCIAGVNELTIGFGATIVGAVLAYVAGLRTVQPQGVCTKPPLRLRITRAINRQAASPTGWLGRVLGHVWPIEHRRLNAEVLDLLGLSPGQHVLEIGSGPGHALRDAACRSRGGRVLGVDMSELMVQMARRRNRCGIARGEVDVQVGDIVTHPLGAATYDRIFSVHGIYFWQDVNAVLSKVAAALRPGGRLVLAFRPDGDDIPARFRDPIYRFPRPQELESALRRTGLVLERAFQSAAAPSVLLFLAKRSKDAPDLATGSAT